MSKILVKHGEFTLAMDTDGSVSLGRWGSSTEQAHTSFYWKYGFECPSDICSGIVVPLGTNLGGKSTSQLIGCIGLLVDNEKKTGTYCAVYDAGPSKNGWGEVSIKAAWNLGYSESQANGRRGPAGNFSIYIDPEVYPDYKSINKDYTKLQNLLNTTGMKNFGGIGQGVNTSTAYGYAQSGLIDPGSIDYKKLYYKIVTIDRNCPAKPNYKQMKKHSIGGVIVEAGYLYTASHREVYYRNPFAESQINYAVECGMEYGLIATSRARTKEEAKKELYQLSFLIRKFPPTLGMWIHFVFTKNKTKNDEIVHVYQNELKRLGVLSLIGFYQTRNELKLFSYEKTFYKTWKLWLNEHVSDVRQINRLLDPSFFTIGTSKPVSYANLNLINSTSGISVSGDLNVSVNIVQALCTNNECYKQGKKLVPTMLMVHSTATPGVGAKRFAQVFNVYRPNGTSKCVHGFIDWDNTMYQTLPWNMQAWHCGGSGNQRAIGIELCEPANYSDKTKSMKVINNAIAIYAKLCKQFNISPSNIISHKEGHARGIASNHGDPDHWWSKIGYTMDMFRAAVQDYLNKASISSKSNISTPTGMTHTTAQTLSTSRSDFPSTVYTGSSIAKNVLKACEYFKHRQGKGKSNYSSSGFVSACYNRAGIVISTSIIKQWKKGKEIPKSEVQEGDIVYFRSKMKLANNIPVHCGIIKDSSSFYHMSGGRIVKSYYSGYRDYKVMSYTRYTKKSGTINSIFNSINSSAGSSSQRKF